MTDADRCGFMGECWLAPTREAFIVCRLRQQPQATQDVPTGQRFCPGHASDVSLDDLMDDVVWAEICRKFRAAGRVPPTRELTTLEWKEIE